jgi:NADH dehydrogenase
MDYARKTGIRRFLQMSALGVRSGAGTGYQMTKYEAECYVKESGLDWTIFRPSLIFGPNGAFIELLASMIARLPLVPVVGDGEYKFQPVHVNDVALGFRKALDDRKSFGRIFEFGGPEVMTYNRMLDIIGEMLGKKKVRKVHQPLWLLRPLTRLLEGFRQYPLTNDQITMLLEGNCTEDRSFFELFDITPTLFKDGLAACLPRQ